MNAEWPIGPVCVQCYEEVRRQPSACATCAEVHVLIAVDAAGAAICGPCAGARFNYTCRRCGQGNVIYADRTCQRCVLTERVDDLLRPAGGEVARQLTPLRDALVNVEDPISILGWLRKSPSAQLLAQLATDNGEPITHDRLDELPQAASTYYVRRALVHTNVLPPRLEPLERVNTWLAAHMDDLPHHHVVVIRPFAHWVVLRRARRSAMRRTYTDQAGHAARQRIRTAGQFMAWLDEHGTTLAAATQNHVDEWLTSGTTVRYDVRTFLAWARRQGVVCGELTVPGRSFRQPPQSVASDDEISEQLRRCLHDPKLPPDVRAAFALVALFGMRLTRITQLTLDDIVERDDGTYLRVGRYPIPLPPRVAQLLRASASTTPRSALSRSGSGVAWLFPGRSPGRAILPVNLSKRLRAHGVENRAVRAGALLALAGDLPAPVLADLFGMSVSNATDWARYAKRDWSAFTASRMRPTTVSRQNGRRAIDPDLA